MKKTYTQPILWVMAADIETYLLEGSQSENIVIGIDNDNSIDDKINVW